MDAKFTIHFMEMLFKTAQKQVYKKNTNTESTYNVLAYLVVTFQTSVMHLPASSTSKQVY